MIAELTQPLEAKLRAGHPWIYADALRLKGRGAEAGDVVDVVDSSGEFVGRGIWDPDSPLRVRLWTTRQEVRVDDGLLANRIKQARRRRPFPSHDTTGFRLLNGEGDRTPGLVVDVYGDVAVLRPDGIAAERWIEPARAVIGRLLDISGWVIRRSAIHASDDRPQAEWLERPAGMTGNKVTFLEHGVTYECDVIEGQKTGFFLDQRANRARIGQLGMGRRVLNLFGYTGGFSLAAAMSGAARTTTVDIAKPAIEQAKRNFELNGFSVRAHEFVAADVFDYLEQFAPGAAPFEVVICDPPSFAHRRKDFDRAYAAYVRLFGKVLESVPAGATVALASCSSHISRDTFLQICSEAAQTARCSLVLTGVYGADVDHPVLPAFPEGDYLQCVIGTVAVD